LTISGPGSNQLSIDGHQTLFVFGVFPDKTATLSNLSITNGQVGIWNEGGTLAVTHCVVSGNSSEGLLTHQGALTAGSCVVSSNSGAGFYNDHGVLNVNNCVVSSNSSFGIANNQRVILPTPAPIQHGNDRRDAVKIYGHHPVGGGSLTIANSTISDNSGTGVVSDGEATILNSTISGNSAAEGDRGGGISNGDFKTPSNVTVLDSTISGNSAYGGAGIANFYWFLTIINSTISGNSAGNDGGGIANYAGGVEITNSTISGNSAGSGGGIYNSAGQFGGRLEFGNTIF